MSGLLIVNADDFGLTRGVSAGKARVRPRRRGRLRARHPLALERERGVGERVPPGEKEIALRHV